MGTSTDAILFYGVCLDEEATDALGDPEDALYTYLGVAKASYAEQSAAVAKLGIEIVWHCSGEYPMYGIAVSGTVIRASRGNPRLIKGITDPPLEVIARVVMLCDALRVDPKKRTDVGWHMVSYWSD